MRNWEGRALKADVWDTVLSDRVKKKRGVTSPRWRQRVFLISHPSQDEPLATIHGQGTIRENPRTQEWGWGVPCTRDRDRQRWKVSEDPPHTDQPQAGAVPDSRHLRPWWTVTVVFSFRRKVKSEVAQLCPTLCDPLNWGLPGSSVHGIFQVRVLEWVAISFSRGSSWPREQTRVSYIVGNCFTIWATREVEICPKNPTHMIAKAFCDGDDCTPTPRTPGCFRSMLRTRILDFFGVDSVPKWSDVLVLTSPRPSFQRRVLDLNSDSALPSTAHSSPAPLYSEIWWSPLKHTVQSFDAPI